MVTTTNVLSAECIADGRTVNTGILQLLLNGGGEIYVPPEALPFVTGPLSVPSNCRLIIDGTLMLAPGANGHLLTLTGSNVHIEGTGVLNGNRSLQTQWGAGQPAPWFSAGIFCGNVSGNPSVNRPGPLISNITIEGIEIVEFENWPISLGNIAAARLRDIQASRCGNSLQFTEGASNCIADSLCVTNISDHGIALYGGTNNCTVRDSIVENCAAGGVAVLMDVGSPNPCNTSIIHGNRCAANAWGLWVGKGDGFVTAARHVNLLVSANMLWVNKAQNMRLDCCQNVILDGNMLVPIAPGATAFAITPEAGNVVRYGNPVE